MAIGGDTERCDGSTAQPRTRSRTSLVIDLLLSRESWTGEERRTSGRADRRSRALSTSVDLTLERAPVGALAAHLSWLVAQTQRNGQLSGQHVLLEDQARILIDALDGRGEKTTISRALTTFWNSDDAADDAADIFDYAVGLDSATAHEPVNSPYLALAKSAARVAAQILDRRGATTEGRPPGCEVRVV